MFIKLEEKQTNLVLNQPELGMGYQQVNLKLKNNKVIKNVLVINAEVLEIPDEFGKIDISDIIGIKLVKIKNRKKTISG